MVGYFISLITLHQMHCMNTDGDKSGFKAVQLFMSLDTSSVSVSKDGSGHVSLALQGVCWYEQMIYTVASAFCLELFLWCTLLGAVWNGDMGLDYQSLSMYRINSTWPCAINGNWERLLIVSCMIGQAKWYISKIMFFYWDKGEYYALDIWWLGEMDVYGCIWVYVCIHIS